MVALMRKRVQKAVLVVTTVVLVGVGILYLAMRSFGTHWGPVTRESVLSYLKEEHGTLEDLVEWSERGRWGALFIEARPVPVRDVIPDDRSKIVWADAPVDPFTLDHRPMLCYSDRESWLDGDLQETTIWVYVDRWSGAIKGWYVQEP